MGGREPARIAAQIVTGVGFLGAGSILRDQHQITGLTTAATIWTVSALGIVCGAGYATAAVLLSLGVLVVLVAFRQAEVWLTGFCSKTATIVVYRPAQGKTRALIVRALDEAHGRTAIDEEKDRSPELREMRIHHCDRHREHRAFVAVLASMPNIEALEPLDPLQSV
jgi:putative Mg2+ transporter-C (MgtC) family protein